MRVSVLLVIVCLRVCRVRAEGIDKEKNHQSPEEGRFSTESQAELQDQESKVLKAENSFTKNAEVEFEISQQNLSSSTIYQPQINKTIHKQTEKTENETKIEDAKDVKRSVLANPHAISEKYERVQRNGSNVGDIYLAEDYIESTTLTFVDSEAHDTTKLERRSDDDVAFNHQGTMQKKKEYSRIRGGYKIRRMTSVRHSPKMMQRRTFDFWSLLGMGEKKEEVVKITKEVPVFVPYTVEKKIPVPFTVQIERKIPVAVPKPYLVPVEKKVYYAVKEYVQAPYPVYKKVPYLVKVMVENPVPVHVSKPYPIYIEKKVPYAVEKEVPYPVKVPVDRPVPVHIPVVKNVYYPVEKKVPFPVAVPVEQPIPVPVEKPYPIYVKNEVQERVEADLFPAPVEESIQQNIIKTHDFVGRGTNKEEFVTSEIDTPLNEGQYSNSNSFTSLGLKSDQHDHTQIHDKKDAGDEHGLIKSNGEEKLKESQLASTIEPISTSTQLFTPEKKNKTSEGEEPVQEKVNDFGRRIKKKRE